MRCLVVLKTGEKYFVEIDPDRTFTGSSFSPDTLQSFVLTNGTQKLLVQGNNVSHIVTNVE